MLNFGESRLEDWLILGPRIPLVNAGAQSQSAWHFPAQPGSLAEFEVGLGAAGGDRLVEMRALLFGAPHLNIPIFILMEGFCVCVCDTGFYLALPTAETGTELVSAQA